MEEEESKWRMVLSKKNEALYYQNKITGLQRWTTHNCICIKSKYRGFSSPILPCCVKEIPKNSPALVKDFNFNEPGTASSFSVELFSKKDYCLSDIIKELGLSTSLSQKRKNYTDIMQETKKSKLAHSPTKKIKTLWPHKNKETLLNNDVSMTTQSSSASQVNDGVSLTTEGIQTQTVSSPVDDFLARIGLQPASKNNTVTMPTTTVSLAIHNEQTTAVSMPTQNDTTCTTTTQSESVDVTMIMQNDLTSVPMTTQSDVSNVSEVTVDETITEDKSSTVSICNTAPATNTVTSETTHVTIATGPEEVSVLKETTVNGYNLRSSGEEGADLSQYPAVDYLPKLHSESKRKKKRSREKPKRAVGRPRKKTFNRPNQNVKPQASEEIKNDSLTNQKTSSELANSDCSTNKDTMDKQIHVHDREPPTGSSDLDSLNGATANDSININVNVQTEKAKSALDSDHVTHVEENPNTQNAESNTGLSRTITDDGTPSKNLIKRKHAKMNKIRAIGSHRKRRKHVHNKTTSNTSQETSHDKKKETQTLLEQSIQELLELEPLSTHKDSNNDSDVDIESIHEAHTSLCGVASGSDIMSPLEILSPSKNTSSVATSTQYRSSSSSTYKVKSKSKACLANTNNPIEVNHTLAQTPSASSDASLKSTEQLIDNLPKAKIQFISDNNLKSGAAFFTGKNVVPKHIESVVETLKCSPIKVPVRGDISVQTKTWLVDILSELDTRKRSKLPNEQQADDTHPVSDRHDLSSSSRTSTASETSPDISDESFDEYLNKSQTHEKNEYVQLEDEHAHPSAATVHSLVQTEDMASSDPVVDKEASLSDEHEGTLGEPEEEFVNQNAEDAQPVLKSKAPSDLSCSTSPLKQVQNKENPPPVSQPAFKRITDWYRHGGNNLTEVDASYIDLSWRIVTSVNGQNSTSLNHLHKLIPVHIQDESEDGACSFLGIAGCSDKQVIAKILNTCIPEVCQEVFVFKHKPAILDKYTDKRQKRNTLSFKWERGKVSVLSKSQSKHSPGKSRKNDHITGDSFSSVQLPKPLKLPEAGSKVYLGEFLYVNNHVEFVTNLMVVVTLSPRSSLSMPPGALAKCNPSEVHAFKVLPLNPETEVKEQKKRKVNKSSQTDDDFYNPCHICEEHIYNFGDSKTHRKQHTKTLGLTCSECPKKFSNAGRLSVHVSTHQPIIMQSCAKCKMKFRQPQLITDGEYHTQICRHCRGDLTCKKCLIQFNSSEEICLHVIETHGKPCRICAKKFIYKADLVKHMKVGHQIDIVI